MSSKPIVGNIPENVTYFFSATKKLESYWEDDALHAGWVGQEVTPAFCSDSINVKTMETGRNWANGWWNQKKVEVKETSRKNDPIKGIKIISLEKRSEGGRAYKVVTLDNFYFDLREDVLMDTMLNAGISKDGILNGTYIWARVRSEMKLVRVGSALHDALLVSTSDRTLKKLSYGNLEVGHIYKGKGAEQFIFLGYVDCSDCEYEPKRGYGVSGPATISRTEIRNGLLLWSYDERSFSSGGYSSDFSHIFCAKVKTTHSFVKDCGTVKVPDNVIDIISEEAYKSFIKEINERRTYANAEDSKFSNFAYQASRITVRKAGEPERKFSDVFLLDKFPLKDTIVKKVK